jgi:hypothetical protein
MVGPSALGIITGLPASIMAAAELVVPKSIPNILSRFVSLIVFTF